MQTLHFSISIQAPRAQVHQTMLADKTYRLWTSEFAAGSYYQGSWEKGTQILFLNPEGFGMKARVAEHRPAEFVSLEMLSEVHDGVPEEQDQWQGSFENYSYLEENGMTTLNVDIGPVPDDWADYLNTTWPKALTRLKAICEDEPRSS
ncbi:MAG: hypothetical protein HGA96_17870 [Desulfobulbaceae bacterium]|nr:hypothetical protein [Desulfobulbaceae bacterium]